MAALSETLLVRVENESGGSVAKFPPDMVMGKGKIGAVRPGYRMEMDQIEPRLHSLRHGHREHHLRLFQRVSIDLPAEDLPGNPKAAKK